MRFLRVLVCVALLGSLTQAQLVVARLPASGTYQGYLDEGAEAIAVQGVPGEISVIRLHGHGLELPDLGQMVEGWSLTLLQANQPTWTWSGGTHASLESDPVQFGLDGVIVALIRSTQQPGVAPRYELRTSSRLPKGFKHPGFDGASPLPGGQGPALEVETWLRPGLELRVRMGFHPTKDLTLQAADEPSQLVATPPYLGGDPWMEEYDTPDFPFPAKWIDSFEPSTVVHASYKTMPDWFNSISTRVRRRKVVVGQAKSTPLPIYVKAVQTDSLEVPVGGHVEVMAQVQSGCAAPALQSAHVLLSSLNAVGTESGFDLTGPVELELVPGYTPVSVGVDLPAEVPPGLYRILLVVGLPDEHDACSAKFLGAYPLALRVLGP